MSQYDFEDSLRRINETMAFSNPLVQDSIPDTEEITEKQPFFANATVVYVLVESAGESPQVLQSFISESSKIARAHSNCRDVICLENSLVFIYSSAFKTELGYALDDAARIRSLSMVVSKLGKNKGFNPIKVNIGIHYGVIEMYRMNSDKKGIPKYAWRGPAIDVARRYAAEAHDGVLISRAVWSNLNENNQKLFSIHNVFSESYHSQIVNVLMNNWLNKSI